MAELSIRSEDLDGNRHYTYPPTEELFTSVTTVLGRTNAKSFLQRWAASEAAKFAIGNLELIARLIAEKGPEEGPKAALVLISEQSEQKRHIKADAGTFVHDVQEALILWASPEGLGSDIALPPMPEHLEGVLYDGEPIRDVVDFMVDGFIAFVHEFNPVFLSSEMTVFHPTLRVAGTLDADLVLPGVTVTPEGRLRIAKGDLTVTADTKTGRIDCTMPEQVAVYRRMPEALMPQGEVVARDLTQVGACLHLRPEHHHGFQLRIMSAADDAKAWNRFRRAADLVNGRDEVGKWPGVSVRPLRADGTSPVPLKDLRPAGYRGVIAPLLEAGLEELDDVALMAAADLLAVKGLGKKTVDTVRRMLDDHGLTLAGEKKEEVA